MAPSQQLSEDQHDPPTPVISNQSSPIQKVDAFNLDDDYVQSGPSLPRMNKTDGKQQQQQPTIPTTTTGT